MLVGSRGTFRRIGKIPTKSILDVVGDKHSGLARAIVGETDRCLLKPVPAGPTVLEPTIYGRNWAERLTELPETSRKTVRRIRGEG